MRQYNFVRWQIGEMQEERLEDVVQEGLEEMEEEKRPSAIEQDYNIK